MKKGYVHPYHSDSNPLLFSQMAYLRTLFEATGPEQVSPHYESVSRSRKGLIFLFFYIGTINSISRMGGWAHNEWIRGMIFHHEFLIAMYIGYNEIRHYTYFLGPKFSNFYNIYSDYEFKQLFNQWTDSVEEIQLAHLVPTKQQIEFNSITAEYQFVKKRALINFLTNEKLNLERHFHNRVLNMLNLIKNFED